MKGILKESRQCDWWLKWILPCYQKEISSASPICFRKAVLPPKPSLQTWKAFSDQQVLTRTEKISCMDRFGQTGHCSYHKAPCAKPLIYSSHLTLHPLAASLTPSTVCLQDKEEAGDAGLARKLDFPHSRCLCCMDGVWENNPRLDGSPGNSFLSASL